MSSKNGRFDYRGAFWASAVFIMTLIGAGLFAALVIWLARFSEAAQYAAVGVFLVGSVVTLFVAVGRDGRRAP